MLDLARAECSIANSIALKTDGALARDMQICRIHCYDDCLVCSLDKGAVKRHLKRLAALTLGFVIGCLVIELVLRVHNPLESRIRGDKVVLPVDKRYILFNRDIPGIPAEIVHTKNSLGFRGPEIPSEDFEATLSVIAVGGSTTECVYLPDGDDWPAVLADLLKPQFPRVWINNAGFEGHSTFGHVVLMDDYIARIRPKVVLFLIGQNEVANTGVTGFEASRVRGRILFSSFRAFAKSLSAHSELGSLLLNLYRVGRARFLGLPHEVLDWTSLKTTVYPESNLDAMIAEHSQRYLPLYEKRLRRLISSCAAAGVFPVFITQPTLFGPGVDPVTHLDLAALQVEGLSGYAHWKILESYNDVTRRIGMECDVPVVDLAADMPRSSLYYYDSVHYTVAGSKEVATCIARRLIPILLTRFPEYVDAATTHEPPPQ
ncbi:MAG TPA: SGNH/GDSL hydrolase family protein [Thermoanaerobaculales bacterium]|nr:SGNH/GDSL hydrolase family protein [Thermoanaerobaculales bacterium]